MTDVEADVDRGWELRGDAARWRPDQPPPARLDPAWLLGRAARHGWAATRWVGRSIERMAWAVVAGPARWPVTCGAAAATLVWATPVTLRHAEAGGVGYVAAVAVVAAGSARRARLASVTRWSTFRRRRRRVRRRWVTAMTIAGLVFEPVEAGGARRYPRRRKVTPTGHGLAVMVDGTKVSVGAADFRRAAGRVCLGFGAQALRATDTGRRGRVRVELRWAAPFPPVIRFDDLPPATRPGWIVIGLDEDGHGMQRNPFLPQLTVGAPGSGKSTETWTTIRALQAAAIPHRLRVFDPKGGMELGALKGAAWAYESNPAQWATFLAAACDALQSRQQQAERAGLRAVHVDERNPLDVMVIDELVTVLSMSRGKVRVFGKQVTVRDAFLTFMSQCRSAGFSCIALSQLAEKEILGAVRGLFSYANVLRVGPTEAAIVDVVLGQGAHAAYPAHELVPGPSTAGIGWERTEGGIIQYRPALLDEAEREALVEWERANTARLRGRP